MKLASFKKMDVVNTVMKRLNIIILHVPSELESQILQLGPDFFSEEPDLSEDLPDLDINYNQVYYQLQPGLLSTTIRFLQYSIMNLALMLST